jgi:hypothetical protein
MQVELVAFRVARRPCCIARSSPPAWEAAELDGGRLCEVVYTILDGFTSGGTYAATASKPSNFGFACKTLEARTGPESARLTIPRMLTALYHARNHRGVGHVGGDVSANHMDSEVVLAMSKWIVAELVRLFHDTEVKTATDVVDALMDRTQPVIWEVDGVKRILDTGAVTRRPDAAAPLLRAGRYQRQILGQAFGTKSDGQLSARSGPASPGQDDRMEPSDWDGHAEPARS